MRKSVDCQKVYLMTAARKNIWRKTMKKRILSLLLVLLMVVSLVPVSAFAADESFKSGDFTFAIEGGVACVRKYNGS